MAYIGRDIEYGSLSKQSFVADSSTTSFSLNYDVASAMSLLVSVGGIVQEPDVGYTATGRTITFASAPISGDTVFIVFLGKELLVSNTTPQDAIDYQTMVGNGSNTLTLNHSVTNPQDLLVTYSGVNQKPGTDYTVSGTTLTFTTTPPTGMKVLVYFMALAGNTLWDGSVTNPKIVSMDAAKLTGTLPTSMSEAAFAPQYQDLSTLALHWASVDNKVAMNLTDDFIDHFQDDSGWVANNGPVITTPGSGDWTEDTSAYAITTGGVDNITGDDGIKSVWTSGTGDFTIQFTATGMNNQTWGFYPVTEDGTWASADYGGMSNMTVSYWYTGNGSNVNKVQYGTYSTSRVLASAVVAGDIIKYTRVSGEVKMYVNSSLVYTYPETSNVDMRFTFANHGTPFDGDIDNITFTSNTQLTNTGSENVYRASDEYVATGSQTTDSNTKLLIHSDTTNGSTTFVDSSGTHTIGVVGNLQHSTAQSKFGSSSIAFDGSGDYISIPDHADIQFGSSDFTIEFWFRTNGTGNSYAWELAHKGPPGTDSLNWWLGNNGSQASLQIFTDAGTVDLRGGPNLADQQWHHLALVRNGSSWYHFADGTAINTQTNSGSVRPASGSPFNLGVCNANGAGDFNGHMDEVRISNSARYTANFTPSSAIHEIISTTTSATGSLLSTTSTADSTVSKATGVMLYKDDEGTNTIGTDLKAYFSADDGSNWTEASSYGSPTTFDGTTKVIPLGETTMSNTGTAVKLKAAWANQQVSSGTAKIITAVGDVQHSATQNKIGASSIYFDGTDDSLTIPDSTDFDFGTGDFTIEFWLQWAGNSQYHTIYDHNYSGSSSGSSCLLIQTVGSNDTTPQIKVWVNGTTLTSTTAFGTVGDNQWYHCAIVRNSGTTTIYRNGVADGSSGSLNGNITPPAMDISIGSELPGSENDQGFSFNGWLDEFRVSNTARYTANFTPSTTAFTTDADTLLLIHSDGVLSPNTTQSSTVDLWSGSTGSFTFSGNNVTATVGNRAIRTAEIAGDCKLEFTATTTNEIMCFGFYESSEDGSFNSTGGRGGMDTMTNSWLWRDEGTDRVGYGSNLALADIPIADGDTVKLERISGEFKLHVNGSVVYTWTQQSTNPLRLCFAVDGPISNAVYTGVTWTGDINNIFTDSSPVSGKIAQLHGWAVNY